MPISRNIVQSTTSMLLLISFVPAFSMTPAVIHSGSGRYANRLSFGNLRKLNFKGGDGRYTLNDSKLERVSEDSIQLAITGEPNAMNQKYRVKVTFLKTMLLCNSKSTSRDNENLLQSWAKEIPTVARILKDQDSIGSLKPIVYDLLEPKQRTDLQLQEELVLLWSSNPDDDNNIGHTELMPPTPFARQIADIQYRGYKGAFSRLTGKIILQILYLKDHGAPLPLGAFVIVSKPAGEYEFYAVPRECLDRIFIPTS